MHEEGGQGVDDHTSLRERVAHFQAKGEAVIVGDLNARTGGRDDRAEATDVNLSRELGAMHGDRGVTAADYTPSEWCARVEPRASRDVGITNEHGTFLLDMCRELYVSGDPYPQWTTERG